MAFLITRTIHGYVSVTDLDSESLVEERERRERVEDERREREREREWREEAERRRWGR